MLLLLQGLVLTLLVAEGEEALLLLLQGLTLLVAEGEEALLLLLQGLVLTLLVAEGGVAAAAGPGFDAARC